MYSSTMDSLLSLYPRLSVGSFVIIDDYGGVVAEASDGHRAGRRKAYQTIAPVRCTRRKRSKPSSRRSKR